MGGADAEIVVVLAAETADANVLQLKMMRPDSTTPTLILLLTALETAGMLPGNRFVHREIADRLRGDILTIPLISLDGRFQRDQSLLSMQTCSADFRPHR